MRRIVVPLVLISVILMSVPAAIAVPSSPFTGAWEGIDVGDDSLMHLTVSGGAGDAVRVAFTDVYATLCVEHFGAPAGPASLRGTGSVDGTTLTVTFGHIRCTGGIILEADASVFEYSPDTDMLVQDLGDWGIQTWYRTGARP